MIENFPLRNILFIDIETVPAEPDFTALDPEMQQLWEQKTLYQRRDQFTPEAFYERAGIWAEFGKIVCISAGFFTFRSDIRHFRVTSFIGDEIEILRSFTNFLESDFSEPQHVLCGHNSKEFDIPFICRRMLANGLRLPSKMNLFGKKPWEIPHLDTLELWKFGDHKHFTSLALLARVLGIPSPKSGMDGCMVSDVFYNYQDLDRIVEYCEADVIAVAQVLLRLRRDELLDATEILRC